MNFYMKPAIHYDTGPTPWNNSRGVAGFGSTRGFGLAETTWLWLVILMFVAYYADVYSPFTRAINYIFGDRRKLRSKYSGSIGG